MAVEEKQCWRIFPCLAVDALDARWCESLCFKYWVGFLICDVTVITIIIILIISGLRLLVPSNIGWLGFLDACHISKS